MKIPAPEGNVPALTGGGGVVGGGVDFALEPRPASAGALGHPSKGVCCLRLVSAVETR